MAVIVTTLSGCGAGFGNLPNVNVGDNLTQTPLGAIKGKLYGGQSPVYLNHVYLMKAGHGGYGSQATSILAQSPNTVKDTTVIGTPSSPAYYAVTDTAGAFDLTGEYSCTYNATHPEQSDLLYVIGIGGQTGFSFDSLGNLVPSTNNPYIGEMAVLGQCPSDGTFAGHLQYVYVGEESTVAAAYALAPFAGNAATGGAPNSFYIGSPSAPLAEVGMTQAFANANLMYDIQGSSALHEARTLTANSTGTVPYLLLDTLGNIMASCVDSSNTGGGIGTTTGPTDTLCNSLWTYTGANTTDTAAAMISIAQNPTRNVGLLFALQPSVPEFDDKLTTAPNDFSVGINYSSALFANAVDIAVDGNGAAWVTNSDGNVAKIAYGAAQMQNTNGIPKPSYVSIDPSGHAWVTSDIAAGGVYELDNAGSQIGQPYSNAFYGDMNFPMGIAQDGKGNTYVANSGGGTTLLGSLLGTSGDMIRINGSNNSAPGPTYSSYYNSLLGHLLNSIPSVSQVAVDSNGDAWLSGDGYSCTVLISVCFGLQVQKVPGANAYNNLGLLGIPILPLVAPSVSVTPGSTDCFLLGLILCTTTSQVNGIAIDSKNTAWVAVSGPTQGLYTITTNGSLSAPITGGGLSYPQGVAIDGLGNVFVANTGNASISEYVSQGATKGFVSANGITGSSNSASSPKSVLNQPFNLDIDGSGDVWIANAAPNYGFVTEFIGIAAPTVRPLSTAVKWAKLASRPM